MDYNVGDDHIYGYEYNAVISLYLLRTLVVR